MIRTAMLLTVAAVGHLAASSAIAMDVAKGSLVPIVPVPNSALTIVFGINDASPSGVIAGSWIDASGFEHGYFGPVSGTSYTTFDDPKSPGPGTEPRGINNNGYITGFSNSQNGSTSADIPFERDPQGNVTEVTKGGTLLNDLIQGINNANNEFAGGYLNTSLQSTGYLGANAKYTSSFKLKGVQNTGYAGRGINNAGEVVGWYYDASGVQHGFVLSGGRARKLDPKEPNLASNVLEGINNKGVITGFWTDTSGIIHGYYYNSKRQRFTSLRVRGSSTFVQAWGINNSGVIAVGSDVGYYIYCPPGVTCPMGAHFSQKQLAKPEPQVP
jgi:probable HAF family extracellular repeat protein